MIIIILDWLVILRNNTSHMHTALKHFLEYIYNYELGLRARGRLSNTSLVVHKHQQLAPNFTWLPFWPVRTHAASVLSVLDYNI